MAAVASTSSPHAQRRQRQHGVSQRGGHQQPGFEQGQRHGYGHARGWAYQEQRQQGVDQEQQDEAEEERDFATLPVSKLKSQLRQTRRLLAREDVTPDLRATSERRELALADALAERESANKHFKLTSKYKKVRFFDRQKLLRRIKRVKAALEGKAGGGTNEETSNEAPVDASADELARLRVDLNYVLRYPASQVYHALFPEGQYAPHPSKGERDDGDARGFIRTAVAKQMKKGTLPLEPENDDVRLLFLDDSALHPPATTASSSSSSSSAKKARASATAEEQQSGKAKQDKKQKDEDDKKKKKRKSEQDQDGGGPAASTDKRERKRQKKQQAAEPAPRAAAAQAEDEDDRPANWAQEDDFFA